jgi:AcrR family transcriptional regulator
VTKALPGPGLSNQIGQTYLVTARVPRRPGRPAGGRLVVDRARLLDVAEVVIRRDGAGASIESIAAEAGVTKPIVYARVGHRSALADALAQRLAERLIAAGRLAIDSRRFDRPALAALVRVSLETIAEHRELFFFVTRGTDDDTPQRTLFLAEQSVVPFADLLSRWRSHHGLDPTVATPWAYGVIGMLNLVSLWWLQESDPPAEVLAEQMASLLWSGLAGP